MYCGKCGQEIPDHSVFCGKCGARLQDTGNKKLYDNSIEVKQESDAAKQGNKFGKKKSRKLIIGVSLVVLLWLVIGNVINRNHVHGSSEEARAGSEETVTSAVMESTKETSFSEESEIQDDLQEYVIQEKQTETEDPVFILNTADIEYYFPVADERKAKPTAYVRGKDLWTDQDGYGSWWVREDITVTAWMVNHLGNVCDVQEYREYGIRPVIYLSLNE